MIILFYKEYVWLNKKIHISLRADINIKNEEKKGRKITKK